VLILLMLLPLILSKLADLPRIVFQENLHVMKVKGHRIALEEIVSHHAREVKAKHVFPWERSIVETRDVLFLYVSKGKLMHGIRHDFQLSAATDSFGSFV